MNRNVETATVLAIQEAQVRAIAAALEASLKELGVQDIEGVPVSHWIHHRTIQETQTVLIAMEDQNPGAAAKVQQHLDEMSRKLSGGLGSH